MKWPEQIVKYVDCMDLPCFCPAFNGTVKKGKCHLPSGEILKKAVRKEYRQMTKEERKAYVDMLHKMKNDGSYRMVGKIHQSAGVHSG